MFVSMKLSVHSRQIQLIPRSDSDPYDVGHMLSDYMDMYVYMQGERHTQVF